MSILPMLQAVLARPPPSRIQDPLRQMRSYAPQPAASVDPFAAMGQHGAQTMGNHNNGTR